jgi:hypothetical protein
MSELFAKKTGAVTGFEAAGPSRAGFTVMAPFMVPVLTLAQAITAVRGRITAGGLSDSGYDEVCSGVAWAGKKPDIARSAAANKHQSGQHVIGVEEMAGLVLQNCR